MGLASLAHFACMSRPCPLSPACGNPFGAACGIVLCLSSGALLATFCLLVVACLNSCLPLSLIIGSFLNFVCCLYSAAVLCKCFSFFGAFACVSTAFLFVFFHLCCSFVYI